MSRELIVTRKRRIPYRRTTTPAGEALPTRCIPANPEAGAADVFYEGLPVLEIPKGSEITISNRSGDRKKVT